MDKRKKIIYGISFIVFFVLIFLYALNISSTDKKSNFERLENSISITENSIRKSIEHQTSLVYLSCGNYNLSSTNSYNEALKLLQDNTAQNNGYYLINSNNTLNMPGAPLNGKAINSNAINLSNNQGHSITSVLDLNSNSHYVVIVIPLRYSWNGYIAKVYNGNDFVNQITSDVPISKEYLCMFDEFGNLLGRNSLSNGLENTNEFFSVIKGASEYSYNHEENSFQSINSNKYNIYFNPSYPHDWFFGTQANIINTKNAYFMNIPVSAVIMFSILVFLFVIVIVLDIVNERETKKKITKVIHIDSLTGLINSTGMKDIMDSFMQKRSMQGYTFVCMDIVSFSRINTMFGYSLGDILLKIIAETISQNYYCGSRTNADCFVFIAKPGEGNAESMEKKFFSAIEDRMGSEYLQIISFKFGIFPFINEYDRNFRDIYDGALLALKNAKKHPTVNEMIFNDDLKNNIDLQRNIEINMMHALSKEEFLVYIQPQINLPNEECERGEALIRWNSEFMGFMPPDKFIPVFEGNGFIVETDLFMLTRALQTIKERLDNGQEPITIAVNQSKVTITFPNYYKRLKMLISNFPNVPLKYIELEITESTLENDWETIVPLIHSMKKLGFSIAMDDFGSGFSSLNTLRILPIDILKIDKNFLSESDKSERCRIIIKNIIRMAKELGITLICEGVESEDQLEFLKENNCDIVQGYLYSKPIPINEFLEKFCN